MATTAMVLGGLDLIGGSNGEQWVLIDASGWDDGLDPSTSAPPRPFGGSYPSRATSKARQVSLRGAAIFTRADDAAQGRDRLVAACPAGSSRVLSRTNVQGTRWGIVESVDAAQIRWVGDCEFRWSMTVSLLDGVLYGAPVVASCGPAGSSGRTGRQYPTVYPQTYGEPVGTGAPSYVTLPNGGTRPYWASLVQSGLAVRPRWTAGETGESLTYAGTVAAGKVLSIDLGARRVVMDGYSHRSLMVSTVGSAGRAASWLAVPPGGLTLSWTADDVDEHALLTVTGLEGAWE